MTTPDPYYADIDFVEEIGPIVRELREAKRWNQAKLAAEAGCAKAQISLVESGKRIPHTPMLIRILDALGHKLAVVTEC